MENSKINFLQGIDSLIKCYTDFKYPVDSICYKRELTLKRRHYLSSWFGNIAGIHNKLGDTNQCRKNSICTQDSILDFYIILNKLKEKRKFDLRSKLENIYENLMNSINSVDLVSVVLFLLEFENVDKIPVDRQLNLEHINIDDNVMFHGDTNSLLPNDSLICTFPLVNNDIFKFDSIESNSFIKESFFELETNTSWMPIESKYSNIDAFCSSGYISDETLNDEDNETRMKFIPSSNVELTGSYTNNAVVIYPHSEICGVDFSNTDNWEHEFIEEFNALESGYCLNRRFVWEDRAKNVGRENPRILNWFVNVNKDGQKTEDEIIISGLCISRSLLFKQSNSSSNQLASEYLSKCCVPIHIWIKDVILMRLGISSSTFSFNKDTNSFSLIASFPTFQIEMVQPHIEAGTIFCRFHLLIEHIRANLSDPKISSITVRVIDRLADMLQMHRLIYSNMLTSNADYEFNSLLEFSLKLEDMTEQISFLGEIWQLHPSKSASFTWTPSITLSDPQLNNLELLSYLYGAVQLQIALNHSLHAPPLLYMLESGLAVFFQLLYTWIYNGTFTNTQPLDFIITPKSYDSYRSWWNRSYALRQGGFCLLSEWVCEEVLRCGKNVALLRKLQDSDVLSDENVVSSRVEFSILSERADMLRLCDGYMKSVKRVSGRKSQLEQERKELAQREKARKKMEAESQKRDEEVRRLKLQQDWQKELRESKERMRENLKDAANREIERKKEENRRERMGYNNEDVHAQIIENKKAKVVEEIKEQLLDEYAVKIREAEDRTRFAENYTSRIQESLPEHLKRSFERNNKNYLKSNEINETDNSVDLSRIRQTNSTAQYLIYNSNRRTNEKIDSQVPDQTTQDSIPYTKESLTDVSTIEPTPNLSDEFKPLPPSESPHFTNEIEDQLDSVTNEVSDTTDSDCDAETISSIVINRQPVAKIDGKHVIYQTKEENQPSIGTDKSCIKFVDGTDSSISSQSGARIDGKHVIYQTKDESQSGISAGKSCIKFVEGTDPSNSQIKSIMYPGKLNGNTVATPQTIRSSSNYYSELKGVLYPHLPEKQPRESVEDIFSLDTDFRSSLSIGEEFEATPVGYQSQLLDSHILHDEKCASVVQEILDNDDKLKKSGGGNRLRATSWEDLITHNLDLDKSVSIPYTDETRFDDCIKGWDHLTQMGGNELDEILKSVMMQPIITQTRITDKLLLNCLIDKFHLIKRLDQLTQLVFLRDSTHWLDSLFEWKTNPFNSSYNGGVWEYSEASNNNTCYKYRTSDAFCSLANSSDAYDNDEWLSVSFDYMSEQPAMGDWLDLIHLSVRVKWPLNIVMDFEGILDQYGNIMRGLVRLKYAAWCIQQTKLILKAIIARHKFSSKTFHKLYAFIRDLEHWVRSLDGSIGNQSAYGEWMVVMGDLMNAHRKFHGNIDLLRQKHKDALKLVENRMSMLLQTDSQSYKHIKSMLICILNTCHELYGLISNNRWDSINQNGIIILLRNTDEKHIELHRRAKFLLTEIRRNSRNCYTGINMDNPFVSLVNSLDFVEFYTSAKLV